MTSREIDTTPLTFDAPDLIAIPVTIGGKEYVLREFDGETGAKFKSHLASFADVGEDGKVKGMKGNVGEMDLLMAGYSLVDKATNEVLGPDGVRRWPERLVKGIAAKAREINKPLSRDELGKS